MNNRKWVAWHICDRTSHLSIFAYDQQQVSEIAHFVKGSLLNDQQRVSDIAHFVKGTHHIFANDQQLVSDIVHFVKGSLILSYGQ